MIVTPFTSDFYTIFPAPNVEELTEFCNKKSKSEVRNDLFSWGKLCKIDRVPLLWEEVIDLYKPSMEILSQQLNKSFQYTQCSILGLICTRKIIIKKYMTIMNTIYQAYSL